MRAVDLLVWPGDGRTYAYTDLVNFSNPHCPGSVGSEIAAFSSADGLSGWQYHGIVAHKNTSAADAGGLATPTAVVRRAGGGGGGGTDSVLLYFAYEGLPEGGGPRGIGQASAPHPLGPFTRLPPAAPAPAAWHRPMGPGGILDDPQVFDYGGAYHMFHSRKWSTDTPGCSCDAAGRNDCVEWMVSPDGEQWTRKGIVLAQRDVEARVGRKLMALEPMSTRVYGGTLVLVTDGAGLDAFAADAAALLSAPTAAALNLTECTAFEISQYAGHALGNTALRVMPRTGPPKFVGTSQPGGGEGGGKNLSFAVWPVAAPGDADAAALAAPPSPPPPPPQPVFDAAFEGGNIDLAESRWTAANTISYQGARKCGPASTRCSPYTNWAYFGVSNLSVTEPTALFARTSEWRSPPWFSYTDGDDGSDWVRITNATAGPSPAYVHQFERPAARIAFSIPYTPSKQSRRLFADLLGAGTGAAVVQQLSIATSEAGHDVPALNISAAAAAPAKEPQPRALVWFQARQHAWESGASWVADGVARFAASAAGRRLRELADVVITPIVDVDNVMVGGAGKDQLPVDFNRDWCPLGQVARNETGAPCQHWRAIRATVATIRAAMESGRYNNLIFVDSHSPGNPKEPAQVWTECSHGPTAVSSRAWSMTQGYKVLLEQSTAGCGRLAYTQWCAEVGPAYGNQYSGYHAGEISFMYLFYAEYAAMMNRYGARSMSFSHETSAATAAEAHCYGAGIGASIAAVLGSTGALNTTGASTTCTGYPDSCHARPPPPPPPPPPGPLPPHRAGFTVRGAGRADCNGVYASVAAPKGWEHSAFYQKDETHSLYRYRHPSTGEEMWHICHTGVACYYDAPRSSDGASEPPDTGWVVSPGGVGMAPAPSLTPIDARGEK